MTATPRALFLSLLLTCAPAAQTREISVTVVDSKNRPVTGLRREDFSVFDGKERRDVVSFGGADAPSTVGVLLDASGSMTSRGRFVRFRNALLRFFGGCNGADEFSLIAFNNRAQLLLDSSSDPAAVLGALDRYAAADPKGQTAFYDALYLALQRASRGRHASRALLLVTDGQDNVSRYAFEDVRQALKESDAVVYAVVFVDPNGYDSVLAAGGQGTLQELATLSGGAVFYATNPEGLNAAMAQIAVELRSRYTLGFAPAEAENKDGWHEVRVKLAAEIHDGRGRKLKTLVRARHGFYEAGASRKR